MKIGIDLGATKIEYVLLDKNNNEIERDRVSTPKNYHQTVNLIKDIVNKIQKNKNLKYDLGICHPGAVDTTTGFIKNAHNSTWLNGKNLIMDLKKE